MPFTATLFSFSSAKPEPVRTNMNGLRMATKPITGADIYIRKPHRKPKGLNRKDLISLDQARVRPNVIYGGFVDREKEIVMSEQSPLDHLARWAGEQNMEYEAKQSGSASSWAASDLVFSPFMAFRDSLEDFQDVSFYQRYASSVDSLTDVPVMSGPANLIPPERRHGSPGHQVQSRRIRDALNGIGLDPNHDAERRAKLHYCD